MASSSGSNFFILFVFLALIANLAGSVQMNDSKKTDSNRRVKNITLNDAEDRLDELNEMLTQRLMQIDQIRSELGGRETSCSAKDHECSIYYRVKSTNFIRFSFSQFLTAVSVILFCLARRNSTTRSRRDSILSPDCKQHQTRSCCSSNGCPS